MKIRIVKRDEVQTAKSERKSAIQHREDRRKISRTVSAWVEEFQLRRRKESQGQVISFFLEQKAIN